MNLRPVGSPKHETETKTDLLLIGIVNYEIAFSALVHVACSTYSLKAPSLRSLFEYNALAHTEAAAAVAFILFK